jgi:phosphoserine phosphatase RsbU/P
MPEPVLQEHAASQREILSALGHRLRTPLTSIRSFSEIMLRYEVPDPERRRDFLRIIHSEAERLAREIDALLDLRRNAIETGEDFASSPSP